MPPDGSSVSLGCHAGNKWPDRGIKSPMGMSPVLGDLTSYGKRGKLSRRHPISADEGIPSDRRLAGKLAAIMSARWKLLGP